MVVILLGKQAGYANISNGRNYATALSFPMLFMGYEVYHGSESCQVSGRALSFGTHPCLQYYRTNPNWLDLQDLRHCQRYRIARGTSLVRLEVQTI